MTSEDVVVAAIAVLVDKRYARIEAAEMVPKKPGL